MTETAMPPWSWTRLRTTVFAPLLFCSLLLNVVLGGYLAMQSLIGEPQRFPPRGPQHMLAALAERLPPHDAEILREAYLAKEPQIVAAETAGERLRMRTKELLGQPTLDATALRATADEMGVQRGRVRELVVEILNETMQRISPEARMKLAREDLRPR